jgi:hypothetical protein
VEAQLLAHGKDYTECEDRGSGDNVSERIGELLREDPRRAGAPLFGLL